MSGICKHFGDVRANYQVRLSVRQGEIHAILGENGSGNSTLMNMLTGIYSPDAGEIRLAGRPVSFTAPKDAIDQGIGMVHQHFKLVEVFTAKENIIAGSKTGFWLRGKALSKEIRETCAKFGLDIDPDKKIYELSVGEKQRVEIVKMLFRGARVLILDEPTAVLTPQETRQLFDILRKMRAQNCAIVIITHKLHEVMEISDRVTIMRRGEYIDTVETAKTDSRALTEMMVGRPVDLNIRRQPAHTSERPVLEIKDLTAIGSHGQRVLDNMSFSVYGGEILGVAGIAGSGQKEICEIIAGLSKAAGGSARFLGDEILGLSPIEILRRGVSMSFVPEDRLGMGLVAGMDIVANVMLRSYQKKKGAFIDQNFGRQKAEEIVSRYDVSTPSVRHVLKKLSGGNIQKVLLGREVDLAPALLITAYPVRGLDIGASYHVYNVLSQQKEAGVAVLFIGEDLDVLLQLCDRLMVMHGGRVMDIVDPAKVTKEEVGLLMLGHKPEPGTAAGPERELATAAVGGDRGNREASEKNSEEGAGRD
ncbi:MAG: ABC transporter ATP-binding protein [Peptococcaceae bacterium]|nr:ABC transporter ATP-binding protein [Peptococcaceae bacterium]